MVNISPIITNTSHLNSFNIKKKTKTYDVGNLSPDLEQATIKSQGETG
jgi:hypothetical protein